MLEFFKNYLIIQGSIILFFFPFALSYWIRHKKLHKKNINLYLENFFSSKEANYLVFFWAAGEAIIWFVIPEFLLGLIIFMKVRKKTDLLKYDIAGTLVGTLIAINIPIHTISEISKLPYIRENMVLQVENWYNHFGLFGLIFQPFSGVPYKVFNLVEANYAFPAIAFILFSVIVRISRYAIFYMMFNGIYPLLHKYIYKHYIILFLLACFLFSIALMEVYNSYVPQYQIVNIFGK